MRCDRKSVRPSSVLVMRIVAFVYPQSPTLSIIRLLDWLSRRPFFALNRQACFLSTLPQARKPLPTFLISVAALQWQLEHQFGPDPGGGPIIPKQTTFEEEPNPPRADNHAMSLDYEITHKTALDGEPNHILSSVTSAAPGATATTTSSSSITSTCASSESTNTTADLATWAHCMDWQDLECVLLPPDAPEITLMDHSDRVDAVPGSITTPSELTDLMRVDLCGNLTLSIT